MNRKLSLKDIVYDAILDGIFTDEYKPDQILNEKELIEKFGYSKSPVREALIALCSDGILHNIPRLGYQVIRLAREDVQQILDYRLVLEGSYLHQSCLRITSAQITSLKETNQLCVEATNDIWKHWEANTKFHLKLLSFSGNQYAYKQLETSMNTLKRAYAQFYWTTWNIIATSNDVEQHVNIIRSLEEKDIDKALEYIKEDLMDFGI